MRILFFSARESNLKKSGKRKHDGKAFRFSKTACLSSVFFCHRKLSPCFENGFIVNGNTSTYNSETKENAKQLLRLKTRLLKTKRFQNVCLTIPKRFLTFLQRFLNVLLTFPGAFPDRFL